VTQVTLHHADRIGRMTQEVMPFDLDGFFDIAAASDATHDTVAWIDSLARGPNLGRRPLPGQPRPCIRRATAARGTLPVPAEATHPADQPRDLGPSTGSTAKPAARSPRAPRALPAVLLSARPHPRLEPRLWPEGPAPVPVCHPAHRARRPWPRCSSKRSLRERLPS
jgi:hypothetical protein